jgi:hypothetical protein
MLHSSILPSQLFADRFAGRLPIAKLLKIRRYHQIRGGACSPNGEISPKERVGILDDAFSTNGEDSTNCLNRRTRDRLLISACGRNARRTGNFREGDANTLYVVRAEV